MRATPKPLEDCEGCDLPQGLRPVQLTEAIKSKPASGPRWWALSDLLVWRSTVLPAPTFAQIKQNGWSPLADAVRIHVGIERATQAAEAGKLFQTAGLDFWCRPDQGQEFPEQRIGLVGRIAGDIAEGLITLGGERRLSAIGPAAAGLWPTRPADLVEKIKAAGGLSLTLLTPALFANGWRPAEIPGLKLLAAALDRWQPHSGWDLAQWQPRAGRKLVPAGAVYWYTLNGASDTDLAALWLTAQADHPQDRRDGFGLVLPQPWTPV